MASGAEMIFHHTSPDRRPWWPGCGVLLGLSLLGPGCTDAGPCAKGGCVGDSDTATPLDTDTDTDPPTPLDADGDGFTEEDGDCDDTSAAVYPGASETAEGDDDEGDGLDNDCDGVVDEGTTSFDDDSDGSTELEGDCDDSSTAYGPGATEIPLDGIDQNCDASDAGPVYRMESVAGARFGVGTDHTAGYAVSSAGDVDGDGLTDVLIGAPAGSDYAETGHAYLVLSPVVGEASLGDAEIVFTAADGYDTFGCSVLGVGDSDDDGWPDVLVGAPGNGDRALGGGAAYLFLGPQVSRLADEANAVVYGDPGATNTGVDLAGPADLDGDGLDDLVVGSIAGGWDGRTLARVSVILSPVPHEAPISESEATLYGEPGGDYAGQSIALGDFNDDGHQDLLVGAYRATSASGQPGAAYVVYGPVSGERELASADARMEGELDLDYAGIRVAATGDLDADGVQDLAVSANQNNETGLRAGRVYLLSGPVSGHIDLATVETTMSGETTFALLGTSIVGPGDLNGDGYDDLLIGASGDVYVGDAFPGKLYELRGPLSGTLGPEHVSAVYVGAAPNDGAGYAAAALVDATGDGRTDIVVGAPIDGTSGEWAGAAYVVDGALSSAP